jgi:hypothetical protein
VVGREIALVFSEDGDEERFNHRFIRVLLPIHSLSVGIEKVDRITEDEAIIGR